MNKTNLKRVTAFLTAFLMSFFIPIEWLPSVSAEAPVYETFDFIDAKPPNEMIEGGKFSLYNVTDSSTAIDQWTEPSHRVSLERGKEYSVMMDEIPFGYGFDTEEDYYQSREFLHFSVDENGEIQGRINRLVGSNHIALSSLYLEKIRGFCSYYPKTNKTPETKAAAVFQLLDGNKVVKEWTTSSEQSNPSGNYEFDFIGLQPNKAYTLHQVTTAYDNEPMEDTKIVIKRDSIGRILLELPTPASNSDYSVYIGNSTSYRTYADISVFTRKIASSVTPSTGSITIRKTDGSTDAPLSGVQLSLWKDNQSYAAWTTDETGSKSFTDLAEGSYEVREDKSLGGYLSQTDTISFKVDAEGNIKNVVNAVFSNGVLIVKNYPFAVYLDCRDENGNSISGAIFEVRYDVGEKEGQIADSWTSNGSKHLIKGIDLTACSSYAIKEVKAPSEYDGLSETSSPHALVFSVSHDGTIYNISAADSIKDKVSNTSDTIIITNPKHSDVKTTDLRIAKTNEEGKMLEGAHFQLYKGNTLVDEWDSDLTAHTVKGVVSDTTYTLTETKSPKGYLRAGNTVFRVVIENDTITNVLVSEGEAAYSNGVLKVENIPTYVAVSKKDKDTGLELSGAKLQILNAQNTLLEDEWTSTNQFHVTTNLNVNQEYILHEEKAPFGYVLADDVSFRIDENGKTVSSSVVNNILVLKNQKTKITVSRVDTKTSRILSGAVLQILDNKGAIAAEWVSDSSPKEITGLGTDVQYTLRERTAPVGYNKSADKTFTISKDGVAYVSGTAYIDNRIVIGNDYAEVYITKADANTRNGLAGAQFQILNNQNQIVHSWTSTTGKHTITGLNFNETYSIREISAPNGYSKKTTDTTFYLNSNGNVVMNGSVVADNHIYIYNSKADICIAKIDSSTRRMIAGANMQIIDDRGAVVRSWTSKTNGYETITGLQAERTYVIHEDKAPNGYQLANDYSFTIRYDGTISTNAPMRDNVIYIEDRPASELTAQVRTTVIDNSTKAQIAGAQMQLYENGKIIDSWISDGRVHYTYNLKTNTTYTLKEVSAPVGYKKGSDVTFTIGTDGRLTASAPISDNGVILMLNEQDAQKQNNQNNNSGKNGNPYTPSREIWEDVSAGAGLEEDGEILL